MNQEWIQIFQRVEEERLAILSEVSDFGLKAFQNARLNWKTNGPFHSFSSLKNSCSGIPAIVCGAGPSLKEAAPFLSTLESKALILAAGTAFSILKDWNTQPHLFFAFDKETPSVLPECEIPCCLQSRLSPKVVAHLRGAKILAPESGPLPWEEWWLSDERLSFGWTVGNFAMQSAIWMGCNPIILTGMDLCYREGSKYANGKQEKAVPLVASENSKGETVWTQRDFLLSADFCRQLSVENPRIRFINTSLEGLPLGPRVEVHSWSSLSWKNEWDLRGHLQAALQRGEKVSYQAKKEREWNESKERCLKGRLLPGEPVYEYYLAPLWTIYEKVFKQAIGDQDLDIHRQLFFEEVLNGL